jgi:hypothetical protein
MLATILRLRSSRPRAIAPGSSGAAPTILIRSQASRSFVEEVDSQDRGLMAAFSSSPSAVQANPYGKLEVEDMVYGGTRLMGYTLDSMDYAPNLLGKYLKTRRNKEIGVIIPNITNYYYPLLLLGVHGVAAQRGYHIILCNSYRDSELEAQNIHLLTSKQVMGILTVSLSTNNEYLKRFIDKGGNMVLLENSPDIECNKVTFEGRVRGRAHHEVQPARLRPTV